MKYWTQGLTGAGIVLCLLASGSQAQQAAPQPGAAPPAAQPAASGAQANSAIPSFLDAVNIFEDFGKVLFKAVDSNNDNKISQKEATDAADLIVGGFFFRADLNGDGIVTSQEASQAMQEMLARRPWLRYIIQRSQAPEAEGNKHPEAIALWTTMSNLVDSNQDKRLTAAEVRQAVQTTVQSLFAVADTNHDGQLDVTEVNAGVAGIAQTVTQTMFQMADKDRNGQLSKEEYLEALRGPATAVFAVLDANNDGQLSQQEMDTAARVAIAQLRSLKVPEAPNSPANLLRTGRRPEEVAPVPAIAAPPAAINAAPAPAERAVQPTSATIPTPAGAAPAPVPAPPR